MANTVSESIYSGPSVIIPMADVQHIERNHAGGLIVISKHTRWDHEAGNWANNIFVPEADSEGFLRAWCAYRAELESDTLADISPDGDRIRAEEERAEREANGQFGVGA